MKATSDRSRCRRSLRRWLGSGTVALLAASLASCSSSGGGATASKTPAATGGGTTSAATTGAGATTAAANDCVTKATAAVNAVRPEPAPAYPASSVMAKNKGKTVWLVTSSSLPILKQTGEAFVAAATAAGMTGKVWYSTGTVEDETRGIQQAIGQHADGLVLMGDPAQLTNAIKEAQDAKIPMAWFSQDATVQLPASITGSVPADWYADGKLAADWILQDSQCNAEVGVVKFSTLTSSAREAQGVQDELTALCPDCKVHTYEANIATFATALPQGIQTMLQQFPNVKYVVASYDSMVAPVNTGINQLGKSVKVLGHDGNPENFDLIRQGKQVFDLALPPTSFMGAYIVNDIGEAMGGGTPATNVLPSRLIDSSNVGASGADLFPSYADSLGKYRAAWGS
jgi:ribose transport system substrate-binding protein